MMDMEIAPNRNISATLADMRLVFQGDASPSISFLGVPSINVTRRVATASPIHWVLFARDIRMILGDFCADLFSTCWIPVTQISVFDPTRDRAELPAGPFDHGSPLLKIPATFDAFTLYLGHGAILTCPPWPGSRQIIMSCPQHLGWPASRPGAVRPPWC